MTIGLGGFGGAPARGVSFSASGSSLSLIIRSSFFESGDHWYSEIREPLTPVSCRASPPRRSSTQTWLPFALPGRDEVKEMYLPSGLERGEASDSGLLVSWTVCVPSQLTIQRSLSRLSASLSMLETV